ncbi:unnamed protein product [Leptidea sinapis]|uniref:Uncharacterized protein n=1 Tax=Leptidea sinapis TaxID=189913 RepID=A0A5E4QBP9_9NEOP|nr:unnamed protein product [Leptidea sinapis]
MITLYYEPDILALNETWIKEGEEALVPSVTNYRFIHKARTSQRRGGGVGFFIRKGIVTRIKQLPSTALEQLWLEVQLPGAIMAIGTAYRPESVSVRDAIDNITPGTPSVVGSKSLTIDNAGEEEEFQEALTGANSTGQSDGRSPQQQAIQPEATPMTKRNRPKVDYKFL